MKSNLHESKHIQEVRVRPRLKTAGGGGEEKESSRCAASGRCEEKLKQEEKGRGAKRGRGDGGRGYTGRGYTGEGLQQLRKRRSGRKVAEQHQEKFNPQFKI